MKKCRYSQCRVPFEPRFRSTEECCSTEHAIAWARESSPERLERQKKRATARERSELRRDKANGLEKLKSISKLLAEAQREFNRWVLQRDYGLGCVSCDVGSNYSGQWTAGHFRTTAAAPHLRFHPDNAWRQCGQCNFHKSGNLGEYRIRLVAKIGVERVEALENDNRASKWFRDEVVEIRKEFTAKWRALRTARESKAA
jgi:hypothetical protein